LDAIPVAKVLFEARAAASRRQVASSATGGQSAAPSQALPAAMRRLAGAGPGRRGRAARQGGEAGRLGRAARQGGPTGVNTAHETPEGIALVAI